MDEAEGYRTIELSVMKTQPLDGRFFMHGIQNAHQHGFIAVDCWSSTPESWFRLNLKAVMYPSENKLDWCRSWLDSRPLRYLLMILLRIIELPLRERDCLVLKLQKQIQ